MSCPAKFILSINKQSGTGHNEKLNFIQCSLNYVIGDGGWALAERKLRI